MTSTLPFEPCRLTIRPAFLDPDNYSKSVRFHRPYACDRVSTIEVMLLAQAKDLLCYHVQDLTGQQVNPRYSKHYEHEAAVPP